jgi:hypothetical protein
VFGKTVAEFLGEEAFFAAGLGVKGKPGDGYGQQAADFAATAVPSSASKIPV